LRTGPILLSRVTRFSALKRWAVEVAKRRGLKRAKVALARKIGVILHVGRRDGFPMDESGVGLGRRGALS